MAKAKKEAKKLTFEEILAKVRGIAAQTDVSGVGFMAVQVNLSGDNGGVFYVEVKDGRTSVEPYEYYDRQCAISMSADNFVKLIDGELDPVGAFTLGKLKVDGDIGKALEFSKVVKKEK